MSTIYLINKPGCKARDLWKLARLLKACVCYARQNFSWLANTDYLSGNHVGWSSAENLISHLIPIPEHIFIDTTVCSFASKEQSSDRFKYLGQKTVNTSQDMNCLLSSCDQK